MLVERLEGNPFASTATGRRNGKEKGPMQAALLHTLGGAAGEAESQGAGAKTGPGTEVSSDCVSVVIE